MKKIFITSLLALVFIYGYSQGGHSVQIQYGTGVPITASVLVAADTIPLRTDVDNMKAGVFNVLDYGAIDGADQVPIQAAINAAHATGYEGGTVIIPA